MRTLPTGVVTFVMTDIVGSTRLWEEHGEAMADALVIHDRLAEECFQRNSGVLVKARGEGDSLFVVFQSPSAALSGIHEFQQLLAEQQWPEAVTISVRAAIHTGEANCRGEDYYGPVINRCGRIRAIANGGQVLISEASRRLLDDSVTDLALRDLGNHRLKDLLRPEHLWELSEIDADLVSVNSLQSISHNLPIQLTNFIGRESEIKRVSQSLQASRLVTLTGAGGGGKTRLALQVAAELASEFPNGVWFVDLSNTTVGSEIVGEIARSLGLPNGSSSEQLSAVNRVLSGAKSLLVLDNCEHIVDAAAAFVLAHLSNVPNGTILATSREAFQIPGELQMQIRPLTIPIISASVDEAQLSESVHLFLDRVRFKQQAFVLNEFNCESICELCNLLEGIPLALEQAASNINFLTPSQMIIRFRDSLAELASNDRTMPARHRTLKATMLWSYKMLSSEEQELFCRCSVFVRGWSLEAALAVGGNDNSMIYLQRLVDKSLVFTYDAENHVRFQMLQSVKDFASTFRRDLTQEIRRLHAHHYSMHYDHSTAISVIALDHFNILAAVDWLLENDPHKGVKMAIGLRSYFLTTGNLEIGQSFLLRALQYAVENSAKAQLLNVIGAIQFRQARFNEARQMFIDSLDLWEALEDNIQSGMVIHNIALCHIFQNNEIAAEPMLKRAAERYRNAGNIDKGAACELSALRLQINFGDPAGAIAGIEAVLDELSDGDPVRKMFGHSCLALAHLLEGNLVQAMTNVQATIGWFEKCEDFDGLATALVVLIVVLEQSPSSKEASRVHSFLSSITAQHHLNIGSLERSLVQHRRRRGGFDAGRFIETSMIVREGKKYCKNFLYPI